MEEGSDGSSSVSSSPSSASAVSFKKQPLHHDKEYKPLTDVYRKHHQPLPQALTGIKDSNSEGVISALKSLQDRIRDLEIERAVAAGKFKQLSDETRHSILSSGNRGDREVGGDSSDEDGGAASRETKSPDMRPTGDLAHRLDSLDSRYLLQLREIELLKERLNKATGGEKENQEILQDQILTPPPPLHGVSPLKDNTKERLQLLEDKHAKLHAEQAFTSSKLNSLEGDLLQKQWQRRQAQKTSPLLHQHHECGIHVHGRGEGGVRRRRKSPAGTYSHKKRSSSSDAVHITKPIPGVHYHLRLKDIPFVVGKSTGPSHSVTANYQKVVSLMKSHNPLLCGAVAANAIFNPPPKRKTSPRGCKKRKGRGLGSGPSCEELEGLLVALEAEFGRLTFEHGELAALLQQQRLKHEATPTKPSSHSPSSKQDEVAGDIEAELSRIVEQLEGKMEQIEIVKKLLASERRHQQLSHDKLYQKGKTTQSQYNDKSNGRRHVCPCSSATSCHCSSSGATVAESRDNNLKMLKKMKRLQTTLQREDLSWRS